MMMSKQFQRRLFSKVPRLLRRFGNSFLIYDELGIRNTIRRMQAAFTGVGFDYQQYYAVKALPRPHILKIMQEEGCGFDCSSIVELQMARATGAKPKDILLTSNNTSRETFKEARAHGGSILNLDDISFIDKIPGKFPKLICFRLNPGERKTGNEVNPIIGNPIEAKFGVPIEKILSAFRIAKKRAAAAGHAATMRYGLHTMVCSNDLDYKHMVSTYELLLEVAGVLKEKLGITLEFVNMGGGIGIPYRPTQKEFEIEKLAQECWALAQEFREKHGYIPKLLTESGRYVTGPHGVLVNRVINTYKKYRHYAGVQSAMTGLMRPAIYSTAFHDHLVLDPKGKPKGGRQRLVDVVGPICENCDGTARQITLPIIREGDVVVVDGCGAHAAAMAFNYNSQEKPPEFILKQDDSIVMICERETPDDLVIRYLDMYDPKHVVMQGKLAA